MKYTSSWLAKGKKKKSNKKGKKKKATELHRQDSPTRMFLSLLSSSLEKNKTSNEE